jgi:hypothetical protein
MQNNFASQSILFKQKALITFYISKEEIERANHQE